MKAVITGNPEIRNAEWHTEDGKPTDGNRAIFPLCESDENNNLRFVGTAFFICTNGVFVTAKHVVMDQRWEKPIDPLTAIQFIEGSYILRPVLSISVNNSDVAIGTLRTATHNQTGEQLTNPILTLTTKTPQHGSVVTTFAYPKSFVQERDSIRELHFNTSWHSGFVLEYLPGGRDKSMLPGPCYRTTMDIFHGASGGPVMNTNARVFGVNSTMYDGVQESYVSAIQSLGGLEIDDVMMPGESKPRRVTTNELIERGFIVLD